MPQFAMTLQCAEGFHKRCDGKIRGLAENLAAMYTDCKCACHTPATVEPKKDPVVSE